MNTQQKRDVIFVATATQLSQTSYYRRLWLATKNAPISRRRWLDVIADCLRDYDGIICYPNGQAFEIPCVDEVFGHDPSMRWFGYFLSPDKTGRLPKSKTRKMQRLQLLDLYFKIQHPAIADHFKR